MILSLEIIFRSGDFSTCPSATRDKHKRTAVLVVHGIGSQRALETVRGVIKGVWLDGENPMTPGRIWSHPEQDAADIDLTVMTTNEVPGSKDHRVVDFHELYWAHQMSETKPVAVLLWLYELVPEGPDHAGGDQWPVVGGVHLPVSDEPVAFPAGVAGRPDVLADKPASGADSAVPADTGERAVRMVDARTD